MSQEPPVPRRIPAPPKNMLVWPLYGAGIENFGRDGAPVRWPTPRPAADQILIRSDAVGLCYSDVKILRLGREHPRLYRRDLANHPIVQGHEVAMTVVEVGEAWRDRFTPGQRLGLQADIYYRGLNLAYGYVFYGGLAQYGLLGPAALDGDEGSYAIPVPQGLGHAEVALTEPWACVEAAYVPRRRLHVKRNGVLWVIGRPGLEGDFHLGDAFTDGLPGKIIATDVPDMLFRDLAWPEITVCDGITPEGYADLAGREAPGGFDDVIVLDPTPAVLDRLTPALAAGATVNLVGQRPLGRSVQVDAGRVHYDYITYLGTRGPDIGAAYGSARNRADIRPGGTAWIVGAGGPMGRMHLQRMLEMPGRPSRIVAAETNLLRSEELANSFAPLARANGVELFIINPRLSDAEDYEDALHSAHGGHGFDDIVVVIASVEAIEAAMPHLAADGLLVVFGGLARGTATRLDLSSVYLGNVQITGSAGSTISDQAAVLDKVASGHLSTASAVAAIGGIDAARDGVQCLMDRCFPGKMVIFPQARRFPLTALAGLKPIAPTVYDLLGPAASWTREAESEFLRRFAGDIYA
jgi:D-arabinose 1-dehydrogenase-like Zn-dependent alcohol dehydrogenase